jgi:hypothetical protein
MTDIPAVQSPPLLEISDLRLAGTDSPGILAANESGFIYFTLRNAGQGDAYNLRLYASEKNGIEGLQLPSQKFIARQLKPGESRADSLSVSGLRNLAEGMAEIELYMNEANSHAGPPVQTSIRTREFSLPKLIISDIVLSDISDREIRLYATIRNSGLSSLQDVSINVKYPDVVLAKGKSSETLPLLKPDESREVFYTFAKTRAFNGTHNYTFDVDIKDKTDLARYHKAVYTKERVVAAERDPIDNDIPRSTKVEPSSNTYVLIIGNENYKKISPVPHAINDARVFGEYCRLTYNVPKSTNIHFVANAGLADMKDGLDWLVTKAKEAKGGNAELIIYYSGHGTVGKARDGTSDDDQYLVPVDVSNLDVSLSISRHDIYASLSEVSFKRASIFLDACYSGDKRPIVKEPVYKWKGKIFLFASSSLGQVSNPYSEKGHGFFTYFLLKSIWETRGNINYADMVEQVKQQVSSVSKSITKEEQKPQEVPMPEAKDEWKRWKIAN